MSAAEEMAQDPDEEIRQMGQEELAGLEERRERFQPWEDHPRIGEGFTRERREAADRFGAEVVVAHSSGSVRPWVA